MVSMSYLNKAKIVYVPRVKETVDQRNDRIFKSHISLFPTDSCEIWVGAVYRHTSRRTGKVTLYPALVIKHPDGSSQQVYARRYAWQRHFGLLTRDQVVSNHCGEDRCVAIHPNHNWVTSYQPTAPEPVVLDRRFEDGHFRIRIGVKK